MILFFLIYQHVYGFCNTILIIKKGNKENGKKRPNCLELQAWKKCRNSSTIWWRNSLPNCFSSTMPPVRLPNVAGLIDTSRTIQSSLGFRDPNLLDHVCKHNCRCAGCFLVLTTEIEENINQASKFSDACAVYVDSGHRRIESSPRLMLAGIYYWLNSIWSVPAGCLLKDHFHLSTAAFW